MLNITLHVIVFVLLRTYINSNHRVQKVVCTCVCCKCETNHKNKYERHLSTKKHIDTSIVEDDRYKALEDKYKALEEKYKALEKKYKASEDKFLKNQDISPRCFGR